MNEDRLKHIEDMVEQLIRIGGNTVAAIEELRKGQGDLRHDLEELRKGQTDMRYDLEELRKGQAELKNELADFRKETLQRLDHLGCNIDYLANKVIQHDMQLYRIQQKLG